MSRRRTPRERHALQKYASMSEYDYMLDHYAQYDIYIDDDYCDYKRNPHNLTVEQLWFNNVALKYPFPCKRCKTDLETYNRLVALHDTDGLANFDTRKSKRRQCSFRFCMWSAYFVSRRHGFLTPTH